MTTTMKQHLGASSGTTWARGRPLRVVHLPSLPVAAQACSHHPRVCSVLGFKKSPPPPSAAEDLDAIIPRSAGATDETDDRRVHGSGLFAESTSGDRVHGANFVLRQLAERYSTQEWGQTTSIKELPKGAGVGPALGFCTNFSKIYKLGKQIGSGAFGRVYRAECKESGKEVAVKTMSIPHSKYEKDKLHREVQLLSKLSHGDAASELFTANFVDAFEDVTQVYIVMELLEGGAVEVAPPAGVARHDEKWERHVAHVVRNVLRFLASCHSKGIVYRDVKPANFVGIKDLQGLIKGIDVGISRQVERGEECDEMMGTPFYMAPEMLAKSPHYSTAVDLWAVGVMACEMLTGQHPLGKGVSNLGNDELYEAVLGIGSAADMPPLAKVSDGARDFLEGLLEVHPEGRMDVTDALGHPWLGMDDTFHGVCWKDVGREMAGMYNTLMSMDESEQEALASMDDIFSLSVPAQPQPASRA